MLDLNNDGVHLTHYGNAGVSFELRNEVAGTERTGWVSATDGLLVKDVNSDGQIKDTGELVSEFYKGEPGQTFISGLAVLKYYDEHGTHDGAFTAAEAEAAGIKVWVDANHDAVTDPGELKTFAELGIIQINLAGRAESGLVLDGNEVRYTLSFEQNVNAAGEAAPLGAAGSHADDHDHDAIEAALIANPFGTNSTPLGNGMLVVTQTDSTVGLGQTKTYVSSTTTGETIDLATVGGKVDNAFGGTGNDTLNGNELNNWLGGGQGSDTFNGGLGNDVLLIDSADVQANIHGGDGTDTVQVMGDDGVTLNLAQAEVEIAQGGRGDDIFIGGGRSTVYIRGGDGADIEIGGAANDALSGEAGDDLIDGGQGNDVIRGDRGNDILMGGAGEDVMHGGVGDDSLRGGDDSDWLAASRATTLSMAAQAWTS